VVPTLSHKSRKSGAPTSVVTFTGSKAGPPATDFCPPVGRSPNGIHVKNGGWIHDDTVSPWTGSFTFGALFTTDFWGHGFVDFIGGTFFVGAFNP